MKLSKTAFLVLGIGVFIIVFAALYAISYGESGKQKRLNDSLATAQTLLPKLVSGRGALESQLVQRQSALAEAESLLSTAKARFPNSSESIEYDEVLFSIADDCDLEVMSLSVAVPQEKKVEDVTYIVTPFEVKVRGKVEGEVTNILDFVNAIATSKDFASATLELVNIRVPEPPAEGEEPEMPSATIKFVGYSYKGE